MSENETGQPEDEMDTAAAEAEQNGGEDAAGAVLPDLDKELAELQDRLMRAVADRDNTRKRADKEIRDTREYAVSSFAKDMLDVSDNLTRALAAVDDTALAEASQPLKNLVEGVAMIERAFLSKMERHGVKPIEPAPGDAFDPHRHQAVAQIPSEHPSGTVASIMQTGYVIGDRTLRAAMVAVSAGQSAGGDGPTGEPGGNVDVKA